MSQGEIWLTPLHTTSSAASQVALGCPMLSHQIGFFGTSPSRIARSNTSHKVHVLQELFQPTAGPNRLRHLPRVLRSAARAHDLIDKSDVGQHGRQV